MTVTNQGYSRVSSPPTRIGVRRRDYGRPVYKDAW